MDKETLSNYGWVVICVLVLVVMIALATPFGRFIATATKNTTESLFSASKNRLDTVLAGDLGDVTVEAPEEIVVDGGGQAQQSNIHAYLHLYNQGNGSVTAYYSLDNGESWNEVLGTSSQQQDLGNISQIKFKLVRTAKIMAGFDYVYQRDYVGADAENYVPKNDLSGTMLIGSTCEIKGGGLGTTESKNIILGNPSEPTITEFFIYIVMDD